MHYLKKRKLARRTLLRGMLGGVGATVALPVLEIMLDSHGEAFADGTNEAHRFMTWFFGNGVRLDRFVPAAQGQGDEWALTEELMPLATVKDQISVLTGFDNKCIESNKITHHEGMVIFSGYNNVDVGQGQGFYSNAGGPTIDQVIAQLDAVGGQTPIRSVQLGVSKRPSQADFGTTMHHLSHADYLQPLVPNLYPQDVWTQLFGSFTPPEDPSGGLRISVLDVVREQIGALRKKVGKADDKRLEAHLTGINELQKKIEALPPLCDTPLLPDENNVDVGGNEPIVAVSQIMSDLLAYAFACDITRVASYLFTEGASNTIYSDLSHTSAHHDLTHSSNQSVQNNEVHEGVVYTMEQLAYMLERFRNTPDGVGGATLLDNISVFVSSDCSEGWSHSVEDQPMIVCGGGCGKLKNPGIHYASPNGENPSDVLLALLQMYDPTATSVGAAEPMSTTPFSFLLA